MQKVIMVEMDRKGRIIIPEALRRRLEIREGAKFVAVAEDNGIYLSKVSESSTELMNRFDKLSQEVEKHFVKRKITPVDVSEAIKWARSQE